MLPCVTDWCDAVCDRLVCCGVRILRMLETAAQSRLSDAISPEVTCTTLWFMQRVTLTYLMPNENYYTVVSDAENSAARTDENFWSFTEW